jgi:hypothetical protein
VIDLLFGRRLALLHKSLSRKKLWPIIFHLCVLKLRSAEALAELLHRKADALRVDHLFMNLQAYTVSQFVSNFGVSFINMALPTGLEPVFLP